MATQTDMLIRALRDLPYREMMQVAEAVAEKLGDKRIADKLADALSSLRPLLVDEHRESLRDEKQLRKALGKYKRTIVIRPLDKGWRVETTNVHGSVAQAPELRIALNHMLDQIITASVMQEA